MAWKAVTLEIGTVVVELQKPLGASSIQSSRTIRRMQSQSRRLLQKLPLPTMGVSVSSTPYSSLAFAAVAFKSSILRSCFRGGDFRRIRYQAFQIHSPYLNK